MLLRAWPMDRAWPLGRGERVVNLDAEIADRAARISPRGCRSALPWSAAVSECQTRSGQSMLAPIGAILSKLPANKVPCMVARPDGRLGRNAAANIRLYHGRRDDPATFRSFL